MAETGGMPTHRTRHIVVAWVFYILAGAAIGAALSVLAWWWPS